MEKPIAPLLVTAHRDLRCFDQQETQQGVALLADVSQPPPISANLSHFLFASCLVSVAATGLGFLVTAVALPHFNPGPIVVIISALMFALSLLKKTT